MSAPPSEANDDPREDVSDVGVKTGVLMSLFGRASVPEQRVKEKEESHVTGGPDVDKDIEQQIDIDTTALVVEYSLGKRKRCSYRTCTNTVNLTDALKGRKGCASCRSKGRNSTRIWRETQKAGEAADTKSKRNKIKVCHCA